jgi:hypothetical protein
VQPSGPMLLDYKTIILTGGFVTALERLLKSPQYYCRQTVEFLKHKIRSFAAQYHLRTAHMDFEVDQRISHASLFVRFIFQSSARIFFRMPTYP